MEFSNNFYVQIGHQDEENLAFELIINPYTGTISEEPGPNMMWNTEYGMMSGGMMGDSMVGDDSMAFGSMDNGTMDDSMMNDESMDGSMMGDDSMGIGSMGIGMMGGRMKDENVQKLKATLDHLLGLPAETEWLEFKQASRTYPFEKMGRYFSALSNEARLKHQAAGWLVLDRKSVG